MKHNGSVLDVLGQIAHEVSLPDSAAYTPEGRRLLISLGVIDPDPLRVAAEVWLGSHTGPMTEAVLEVRRRLGRPFPTAWREDARHFRRIH